MSQENKKTRVDISQMHLSSQIDQNIDMFRAIFENDNTFISRTVVNRNNREIRCAAFFIDGMVNNGVVNEAVMRPLLEWNPPAIPVDPAQTIAESVLQSNDVRITDDLNMLLKSMLYGDTIVLADKSAVGLIVSTKGFTTRSVSEPDGEKVLRGPREGFNEGLMVNLSLVRRRLRTEHLKYQFMTLGSQTNTTCCVCYIDGVVNKRVLDEVCRRLKTIEIDGVLDANYIQEMIKDAPYSPFKTMGSTERPDIVAAKLLEGRVAIVVDGTPLVLTAPYIFIEHFQSNDDYYLNYYFAAVSRLLRILGFFATISIPAVYLAVVTFHQEMIPTQLLFSVSAAREGVPFPSVVEALGLLLVFEILREAGTRTPSSIGQALSIVGALVLGQAAVDARFVSAPMVIIIAFAGITALMIPRLLGATILLRIGFLLLASLMGLYGYVFGMSWMLIHLANLKSFGVPVLSNIPSGRHGSLEDTMVRVPWFKMKKQGRFLADVHHEPSEKGESAQ